MSDNVSFLELFERLKVQNLVFIFAVPPYGPLQASSLLASLLLLEGDMFSPSSPPAGLLEKVFQYIDLHQNEFVQVGETIHTQFLCDIPFGYLGECLFSGRCGFFFFP